jgi:PhzF family phenazine biosynthesis protein
MIVDAFAESAFRGNPAGVCLLDRERDERWMQNVGMEINQAETAFVSPRAGTRESNLRWFTPTTEVDLCGHATLASAHALWDTQRLAHSEPAKFHTMSGVLTCTRGDDGSIEMDFPATPARPMDDLTDEDVAAFGLSRKTISGIYRSKFDVLIEVPDAKLLRALAPDFARVHQIKTRGTIVTCRSDDARFDFLSRFFAPQTGINEDPVTGSAHCALGPFWSERLRKTKLVGFQASKRGGVVSVDVRGDRIGLGGRAVTVLRGELNC